MVDIEFVYNVSMHKLQNFQTTHRESDGLRKLVLLNNFVYEKFISQEQDDDLSDWSEEDIKKDEESWLDSCLDELDEDDYVHVNVKPLEHQSTVAPIPMDRYDDPQHYEDLYVQDNNSMEYEKQPPSKGDNNAIDDVIIPHDLLHLPFFGPGENFHMDVEEQEDNNNDDDDDDLMYTFNPSSQQVDVLNMTKIEGSSENVTCEKGFHPYWKDNSIISNYPSSPSYLDLNTNSFGPKVFRKYRFDQDDNASRIAPHAVLELLQSGYSYQSPLRRSKDDLDILYSFTPRDVDRGILMDVFSKLEYYGSKANRNNAKKLGSSEITDISDIWFMDNNRHH